jgi:hypothetical protein
MLVVERGVPGVRVIPLEQKVHILGSSPGADVFLDNLYVSRMHAQIVQEGERFRIRDLDSKNGTFVNGTRLTGEGQTLRSGDRIALAEGQVLLRFETRGSTLTLNVASLVDGGKLVVDSRSREVWVKGVRLEPPLSRKEFDVLSLLFQKRGEACSRDEIAASGWPERGDGDVGDQEIEQAVRRIRLRIEPDPSQPRYVITVRGYGYKLSQE